MRKFVVCLAAIGVLGCDRQAADRPAAPVVAAALTYEGADTADPKARIAHGKRLAVVLDCTGCHGANLQGGNVTADEPNLGDIYAPNITLLLASQSDSDLDRLIRDGVPKDGREFWFMPVEAYQFLSDADASAIIAYLRTFKPAGEQWPSIRKGPQFEKDVRDGLFGNSQAQIRKYRAEQPADLGERHAWGRYLTKTTCTACHNNALQGWENFTPSLDIAGAYSRDELIKLLTTGEGKKPKLGMMASVAREHFSRLTTREREAIVDYVLARANRPQ